MYGFRVRDQSRDDEADLTGWAAQPETRDRIVEQAFGHMLNNVHPKDFPDVFEVVHRRYRSEMRWGGRVAPFLNEGRCRLVPVIVVVSA